MLQNYILVAWRNPDEHHHLLSGDFIKLVMVAIVIGSLIGCNGGIM